jgi:glycosyltransferase involved in cell wall biosynthesis
MPTYNTARFIREAIQSVLSQTYSDLALYVVDDGSTDETAEIVASFDDSRVHYVRRDHGGPSAARNVGIAASTAPLIAFIDADDRWRPQKLAAQVELLEREPDVGLVHGFQQTIDAHGAVIGELAVGLRGDVFADLLRGNVLTGSASIVVVRRSVFVALGMFREDLFVAEDWEMWLRIASAYTFDHVPDVLVEVRVHDRGLQQDRLGMAHGRIRMYDEVVASLRLRGRPRARLARSCLTPSVYDYALSGHPERALSTFARLLVANPLALSELRSFRFYLWIVIMALKRRRVTLSS